MPHDGLTQRATAVGRTDDPELIRAYFDAVTDALPAYGPCTPEAAARRKVKSSRATKAPRPSGR